MGRERETAGADGAGFWRVPVGLYRHHRHPLTIRLVDLSAAWSYLSGGVAFGEF